MNAPPADALLATLRADLLARRDPAGPWRSHLSSSALANAVALIALGRLARAGDRGVDEARARGLAWLVADQNDDGGFGDSPESVSNPSTSTLAWAALGLHEGASVAAATPGVEGYLVRALGGLDDVTLARALRAAYGDDQTFSVPILAACAIAGRFGEGRAAWASVPGLPFELAALPPSAWRRVGLPVVSYALPALIAIGQARHHGRPSRNPIARLLRDALRGRTLRVLAATQPDSGGFLEAVPLTAFVLMALVDVGQADHPVARRARAFLLASQRDDGAWPIDANVDTWVTSLAVGALGPRLHDALPDDARADVRRWLLDQQGAAPHPFTHAAPGAWAWTDLSGGVPDADDTPAALLALRALGGDDEDAARRGVRWLVDLQNRDGGIPTFCRGWGRLPFDASAPDLTAHALRAWSAWEDRLDGRLAARVASATARALAFLVRGQRAEGSWAPLWFGHQQHPRRENPVYGTTRVLRAGAVVRPPPALAEAWSRAVDRGVAWLLGVQADDGGWGADAGLPPSIEETALALEALAELRGREGLDRGALDRAIDRGVAWLAARTEGGRRLEPTPIGLYFAQLWYTEAMYPLVWSVSALERVVATRR